MKFVILGFDGPVVLAGPLTDKTGSLIVVEADSLEADSLEEAQRIAREDPYEDPYTVHGVFERVEVHPCLASPASGRLAPSSFATLGIHPNS